MRRTLLFHALPLNQNMKCKLVVLWMCCVVENFERVLLKAKFFFQTPKVLLMKKFSRIDFRQ